jgi:hypothetical protein
VTEFATGPAKFVDNGPRYLAASITLQTEEVTGYLDDDGESAPLVGASGDFGVTQSGDPSVRVRT